MRLKPYAKADHIEPFFVEGIASVFTGLILLAWGVLVLSNDFFQLSLFVRLRNALAGEAFVERSLEGISILDVDPDSILVAGEGRDARAAEYLLMSESISAVSEWARARGDDLRVVLGLDYALLRPPDGESGEYEALVGALAGMPTNLHLVIGGMITSTGAFSAGGSGGARGVARTVTMVRSDLAFDLVRGAVSAAGGDRSLADRIHFGTLHYVQAGVRAGLDTVDDVDAAVAYHPLIVSGTEPPTSYASLALAMLLAGTEPAYRTNHAGGDMVAGFSSAPSRPAASFYLDFPTERDVIDLPDRFRRLFDYSFTLNPLSLFPDESLFSATRDGVAYVIAGRTRTASAASPDEVDSLVTVASSTDRVTGRRTEVSGVMVHVTALANMLGDRLVRDAPASVAWLLALIPTALVAWVALRTRLALAILATLAAVLAVVALAWGLFLAGVFVPVRAPAVAIVLAFATVSSARFIASLKNGFALASVRGRVAPRGGQEEFIVGARRSDDSAIVLAVRLNGDAPDADRERVAAAFARAGAHVDAPLADCVLAVWQSSSGPRAASAEAPPSAGPAAAALDALARLAGAGSPSPLRAVLHIGPVHERVFKMQATADFAFGGAAVLDALVVGERVRSGLLVDARLLDGRDGSVRHRGRRYVVIPDLSTLHSLSIVHRVGEEGL